MILATENQTANVSEPEGKLKNKPYQLVVASEAEDIVALSNHYIPDDGDEVAGLKGVIQRAKDKKLHGKQYIDRTVCVAVDAYGRVIGYGHIEDNSAPKRNPSGEIEMMPEFKSLNISSQNTNGNGKTLLSDIIKNLLLTKKGTEVYVNPNLSTTPFRPYGFNGQRWVSINRH